MAVPVLNSVSPGTGPPGQAIICLGAGFDAGAQVGCPALVETTFVLAGELHAAIPADLMGPTGGSMPVSVYVRNEDGSISAVLTFTVLFGREAQQTWTTVEAVCGEVPIFKRPSTTIPDTTIEGWMRSIAQTVNAAMIGRGLSLDPAGWQQAAADTAQPSPESVLELIVRYGAAARLAAVIGAQFSGQGEWPLTKTLRADFEAQMKALRGGDYDRLFRPAAATVETGQLLQSGDMSDSTTGEVESAFKKDQTF